MHRPARACTHTHTPALLLACQHTHTHTCMHALITGQEVFRNLVLLPPPSPRHAQTSITRHNTQAPMQTPITAAPDASPQGKTWPSPPPRPHPDFIELIWLVTLGDLLARHLGMVVKAVTLLLAPGISLSYRQLTQVCVCAHG